MTALYDQMTDKHSQPGTRSSDLKIVQSAGPFVDKSVLTAVSQYRFKPGTVSDQPVAIPLNLEINLVSSR